MRRIYIVAAWSLGVIVALPAAWLLEASLVWSTGTGLPFTPLAWWNATQWWLANWWVNLWLVAGAVIPTALLVILLVLAVVAWRSRWQIQGWIMMLRHPPTKPWSRHEPAASHGAAAFVASDEVAKKLRQPR